VIITVASQKGGAGKTTTSIFLAHALAEATGARCALIDADPQASAAQWAQLAARAGTPLAVPVLARPTPGLATMLPGVPHTVIDTPPADPDIMLAAIGVADFVLIPTSASALDLSRVQGTVDAAKRSGKQSAVLLNRTRRTRSVGAAVENLRAAGVHVLGTHIPLREALAMAFGLPVRQLHGYDLATAELLGELPEQPYSVEAVRQRAGWANYHEPPARHAERAVLPAREGATAALRSAPSGPNDDEIVQRLKTSMARIAIQR
jgi:chromosome partitioning protein